MSKFDWEGTQNDKGDRDQIELFVNLCTTRLRKMEHGDPRTVVDGEAIKATEIVDIYIEPVLREIQRPRLNRNRNHPFWLPGFGAQVPGVNALLTAASNSAVILGDAGVGKTTFVRRLTIDLSKNFQERQAEHFPIYCDLREFSKWWEASHLAKGAKLDEVASWAKGVGLRDLISLAIETSAAANFESNVAETLFRHRSRAIVILDGLDEVDPPFDRQKDGEQAAKSFVSALAHVFGAHGDCRFILTARSREYYYSEHFRLPESPHYELARFSTEQINLAIDRWHVQLALRAADAGQTLTVNPLEGADRVKALIKKDRALALFASNPLLLQLLQCALVTREYRPASIRDVCERAIEILLRSGEAPTQATRGSQAELVHLALEGVAGHMLVESSVGTRDLELQAARPGVVSFVDFCGAIIEGLGAGTWEKFSARAEDFLAVMSLIMSRMRSIIEYEGPQAVGMEPTFRGVFAGCFLARMTRPERNKLGFSEVSEAAFECFGALSGDQPDMLKEALSLSSQHMADSSLIESVRLGLALLAGIARGAPTSAEASAALVSAREIALVALAGPSTRVSLEDRLAIASALGTIGDPRWSRKIESAPAPVVAVAGGDASVGRDAEYDILNSKYQATLATPQIGVRLNPFEIGLIPVVNAWFAEFIEDGGYDEPAFWTSAEAQGWRAQDKSVLQTLREHAATRTELHVGPLIAEDSIRPEQSKDVLENMIIRRYPLYWSNPRFALDNQPLVGANFWEASAFCEWLQRRRWKEHNVVVRLPREFEWEWAGRCKSTQSDFPWDGNGGVDDRAFVSMGTHPWGAPGPVGAFPNARWGDGPLDLVGNVWEWTLSPVQKYGGSVSVETAASGLDDRITRGGSWRTKEPAANSLYFRSFDPPYLAHEDLGFRFVVAR